MVGEPGKVNGFEAGRCTKSYRSGFSPNKDNAFSFYYPIAELLQDFLDTAPDVLFVYLCELTCKAGRPVCSEDRY